MVVWIWWNKFQNTSWGSRKIRKPKQFRKAGCWLKKKFRTKGEKSNLYEACSNCQTAVKEGCVKEGCWRRIPRNLQITIFLSKGAPSSCFFLLNWCQQRNFSLSAAQRSVFRENFCDSFDWTLSENAISVWRSLQCWKK